MKEFTRKYESRIHGLLSCFDRMLFRGYLPIMSGWAMAAFLYRLKINFGSLKPFLMENSERVKHHAEAMAEKHGRPFRYLKSNIDQEQAAPELAQCDGIEHGRVCIFSILEPCRGFSFLFKKPLPDQRPFVRPARRKCLHLYFYFMDRQFGLIHVRIQTWFPMPIQIYLNRMARTEVEGQRRSLYQTRQCISLHPGHGQGATIRRSIRATELAQDTQPVCPAGHAPTPGPSEGRSALLGYRSKRTIDRHPVQKPSASFRTRSETAQPRHLVLWRQGSHELSWTKAARQF